VPSRPLWTLAGARHRGEARDRKAEAEDLVLQSGSAPPGARGTWTSPWTHLLAAILLIAAAGCSERWEEQHDYGAVRIVEHWKTNPLRWEGSNRMSIYKTRVCATPTGQCLTTSSVLVDRPVDGRGHWIRLMGDATLDQFMDTRSGLRIECLNCAPESTDAFMRRLFRTAWTLDGQRAVGFFGDRHADTPPARLQLAMLEFSTEGFRQTRLTGDDAVADARFAPLIGPDGGMVAWMGCGDSCTLYWIRLADGHRFHRDLGCPYNEYLQIAWDPSGPRAQYDWGAATGSAAATLCRDKDGNVALPIAPRPGRD